MSGQRGEFEIGCGVLMLGVVFCLAAVILGVVYMAGAPDLVTLLKTVLPVGECKP